MIMRTPPSPESLERLLALVGEALALSDREELHATGIALDTARLDVEAALAEARRANGGSAPGAGHGGRGDKVQNGVVRRDRG